ncbi:MAG TPA: hypothetical protein VNO24_21730 [Blastocatellia bacterium]|nr:hypothetical protein [Blastocatellia bacterium]
MLRVRAVLLFCELLLVLTLPLLQKMAFASSARAGADGPVARMSSTSRDFGNVFAGEELEQNFPVLNAGTKPLELSRKSTLGTRSAAPDFPVRAAMWRPDYHLLTRTVAARRAAPS